jgi:integrase
VQRGMLRIEGPSWIGYFSTYILDHETGERKRKQKCIKLGPKNLGKREAQTILDEEIKRALNGDHTTNGRPDPSVSLEAFARSRWLPLKNGRWRPSTESAAEHILGIIFKPFGKTSLESLDKIALQNRLNSLAKTHSDSVVRHCRIYLKSILEEAVEQDYLRKNPAKHLTLPLTKRVQKFVLTHQQFKEVLQKLDANHRLVVSVCLFCGFRPSELFALRWRDLDTEQKIFRIRESVYRGELREFTKTTQAGSTEEHLLRVSIPDALVSELIEYKKTAAEAPPYNSKDEDFIFCNSRRKMMRNDNVIHRVLKPLKDDMGLPCLNFQVLRRTIATWSQHSGSVKDLQGHMRHRSPDVTFGEYAQALPESTRLMVNSVFDAVMKEE